MNLFIDAAQQLVATARNSAGSKISGITFDWSSGNETIGTVNATEFSTAHAEEATTVTVTGA